MAAEDYNVADRPVVNTAGERVAETVQETPEQGTEGTDYQSPYVGYAAALDAHAARADIEGLAERRAREVADTFAAADFMRNDAYNADGTAAAPPRPGTVHGDAPDATA